MDMISNLPKHILHEILSRTTGKDAMRANILSKTWKKTCSTFPVLIFFEPEGKKKRITDEQDLQEMVDIITKRNNFLDRVDSTLKSFHNQGLAIKHFGLVLDFSDPHILSPLIDHWIELAFLSGLEELYFAFEFNRANPAIGELYRFPLISILESKSLVYLILEGSFRLDKSLFITSHPHPHPLIMFSSLKSLSLKRVYMEEEQVLEHLISSCPMIEYLVLDNCYGGLKYVRIQNLPKLKNFQFRGPQEVHVRHAASLEIFLYAATLNNSTPDIDTCTRSNVKDLRLQCPNNLILTFMWSLELFHTFSRLERLELTNCILPREMFLSSVQLKVLKIAWCSNLKCAWINAPSLVSFTYQVSESSVALANVSFASINPTCFEFNVVVDNICFPLHFINIRNFLQNIEPKTVVESVVLNLRVRTNFDFRQGRLSKESLSNNSPARVKQLSLQFFSNSSEAEASWFSLLLGLQWSCRPTIFSIKNSSKSTILLKLLCKTLMGDGDCYCDFVDTKCWWHGSKDVEVRRSSKDGDVVIDCKILLDLLPILSSEEEISFKFKS